MIKVKLSVNTFANVFLHNIDQNWDVCCNNTLDEGNVCELFIRIVANGNPFLLPESRNYL